VVDSLGHAPGRPQVNFWKSLDEALRKIQVQLEAPGVLVTKDVLKFSRRMVAHAALESNTGLEQALKVKG
jgi:hypothetical protein